MKSLPAPTIKLILLFIWLSSGHSIAQKSFPKPEKVLQSYKSDCIAVFASTELKINNVRARLGQGGDLWSGTYEVPKNSGLNTLYAGSVWVGAYDPFGNLKISNQTYRGSLVGDFAAGPLDVDGMTEALTCAQWDRFFKVNAEEVSIHKKRFTDKINQGIPYPDEEIPINILGWPGSGNPFFKSINGFELPSNTYALASFHDYDQDGMYNPAKGDFPVVRSRMSGQTKEMVPSEQTFKIFNDAGTSHNQSLTMQFNATTFAFKTGDEVNDMTFTHHKCINAGFSELNQGRFSYWIDPDLGCYSDDYIGFDSTRHMAYLYNEDAMDGTLGCECNGIKTYCENIPLLGIRFFDTPDQNGVSSFIYYNNGNIGGLPVATIDPSTSIEYYRYMSGKFRDGQILTRGGNGYNPGSQDIAKFAYHSPPNQTDSMAWSMCTQAPGFGDRRIVINTQFENLNPGQQFEALSGNVFVPSQRYPCPDISYLQHVSDKAELFLLNQLLDDELTLKGPDAPDVQALENDREIILLLSNAQGSNNFQLKYQETDPLFRNSDNSILHDYFFEGYLIYQLRNENVSLFDLNNPDVARLVVQNDVRNNVVSIYQWNKIEDPFNLYNIWAPELVFQGNNDGVRSTFKITEDAFASPGDKGLINHKPYYYVAVAFAHNNYQNFDPNTGLGQQFPFLKGQRNRKIITAIPRPLNSGDSMIKYGTSLPVTRLDGKGNPGVFLKLEAGMYDHMLSPDFDGKIIYERGFGPILAKVIDPGKLQNAKLRLSFYNNDQSEEVSPSTRWVLENLETGETILSERDISLFHEQVFDSYGISIEMLQPDPVGVNQTGQIFHPTNGMVNTRILHSSQEWLGGISSSDFASITKPNGQSFSPLKYVKTDNGEIDSYLDPNQSLTNTSASSFVPIFILDYRVNLNSPDFLISPMLMDAEFGAAARSRVKAENTNNVDIILTADKSKWSRCVVIQTTNPYYTRDGLISSDGTKSFDYRLFPSISKDGRYATQDGTIFTAPLTTASNDSNEPNYINPMGMGWFPGYAVDVETGDRLNIFFGENSSFTEDNAHLYSDQKVITNDMIWNPGSQILLDPQAGDSPLRYFMGGQHHIYVTKDKYDACAYIQSRLDPRRSVLFKRPVFDLLTWSGFPVLQDGFELLSYEEGLIPSETIVQLRVNQHYARHNNNGPNEGLPQYLIDIDTELISAVDYNQKSLNGVSIFPNPFLSSQTNDLYFKNIPANCEIRLMDQHGRTLVHQKLYGNKNERLDQITISLSGLCLQSGFYIVEIQGYEAGRMVQKLLCF